MPLQVCLIILFLLVSTTQAAFNSILQHRPRIHSLTTSYGHHKMNRFATAVEDLQSINYREQETPSHRQWDSLHRRLTNLFKGKVWTEQTTKTHGMSTAHDQDPKLNHRDQHIWPVSSNLKFINEPRVKNFRFSENGNKHKPKKQAHLKKPSMTLEPSLDMNPYMPIYYPPPPPVSPTGFPPPPPAAMPPSHMQGSREHFQPRSTEETFNRPTTHLLHTYPTWPSEEYEAPIGSYPDDNANAALYGDTPPSYNDFHNIPTKPSSSNTYSEEPEQATGFPKNYFHPPVSAKEAQPSSVCDLTRNVIVSCPVAKKTPDGVSRYPFKIDLWGGNLPILYFHTEHVLQADVVVRIQTPETSLDWNLPAPPFFTCKLLVEELFNLRYSGVPIHIEQGAETRENHETCVYMKKMLVQAPDENLDWRITISDNNGQTLWENKCLPGSEFYITYGYHVVFEGRPIVEENHQNQDLYNLHKTAPAFVNVDNLHDNSKISNTVPVPRYSSLQKRTWTSPSSDRKMYNHRSYRLKR